jgi:hypothetical protein
MDAYQAALAGYALPNREIGASRTAAGTVDAVIVGYLKHDSFTRSLAPTTQAMRRAILQRLRAEHGKKRFALLQRIHIVKLLEPMKPFAQKNWIKALRGLMAFAIVQNIRADDPTMGVSSQTTHCRKRTKPRLRVAGIDSRLHRMARRPPHYKTPRRRFSRCKRSARPSIPSAKPPSNWKSIAN